jgi:CubicO group peptidase (beta-lactamase class C family)
MNDQEVKNLWQRQKPSGEPALTADEQIAAMRKKMAKMHRGLNALDFWGLAANAVILIVFTIYFFTTPYFVTRIGTLILIGGDLFASWKLIQRRRSTPQPIADAPVMEWLKYDLAKVHQHAEENRTALWWSVLPFLIGTIAFLWGMPVSFSIKIGPSVLMALIAAVTYWLNQRARRKQWLPLQQELEALLHFDQPVLQPEPPKKNITTKTILIGIVLISLGAILFVRGREPKTPAIEYSDPISQMLENIREKHNLPALAAAVVVDGRIVATNAVGFRKNGGTEKVTVNDKFHLGSVTKSMTATVAAMLVEQGKISWTTTIEEAFPESKSEMHPDYLGVTLEQLLSHRSGAPGDAPGDLWRKAWAANGTAAEQRLAFIKGILARKPEAKPGTKFIYSNQGYTIAGVMLEKATGKTWEDLLRSMLFEPLGMTTAGFGAPASVDKVDQPWGHTKKMFSGSEPVPPGPSADNPLAISPAGAVHCSMDDLAKYAAFHMAGERGESKLLTAESFKKLHTAVADNHDYALGWMVLKRPWANGRALMHNGSNTMFYVVVWMAPEKNCAVIVASNIGVDEAFEGCDEAAGKLIHQYFGK